MTRWASTNPRRDAGDAACTTLLEIGADVWPATMGGLPLHGPEPAPAEDDLLAVRQGDALYARRAGNRTFAWYVIDRPLANRCGHACAMAHREHGSQVPRYMMFVEVRHYDAGRWAPENPCEGHPAGPHDPMGQTVYCDGSCTR